MHILRPAKGQQTEKYIGAYQQGAREITETGGTWIHPLVVRLTSELTLVLDLHLDDARNDETIRCELRLQETMVQAHKCNVMAEYV